MFEDILLLIFPTLNWTEHNEDVYYPLKYNLLLDNVTLHMMISGLKPIM